MLLLLLMVRAIVTGVPLLQKNGLILDRILNYYGWRGLLLLILLRAQTSMVAGNDWGLFRSGNHNCRTGGINDVMFFVSGRVACWLRRGGDWRRWGAADLPATG